MASLWTCGVAEWVHICTSAWLCVLCCRNWHWRLWHDQVLLYEMITSRTPYWRADGNIYKIYSQIANSPLTWPQGTNCESAVVKFVSSLLKVEPSQRPGFDEHSNHLMHDQWFCEAQFDWNAMQNMQLPPPYQPAVANHSAPTLQFEGFRQHLRNPKRIKQERLWHVSRVVVNTLIKTSIVKHIRTTLVVKIKRCCCIINDVVTKLYSNPWFTMLEIVCLLYHSQQQDLHRPN